MAIYLQASARSRQLALSGRLAKSYLWPPSARTAPPARPVCSTTTRAILPLRFIVNSLHIYALLLLEQVLCPDLDSEEEGVWMADELETCAFAKLGEMKVVRHVCTWRCVVDRSYDADFRFAVWVLHHARVGVVLAIALKMKWACMA